MILTTVQKMFIARMAARFILGFRSLFGLPSIVLVNRLGIRWKLDLKEGIDLSIYLMGGFELKAIKALSRIIIGANIGAYTLPLAAMVGDTGKVIAIEPTEWAFRKLKENLELNPNTKGRVIPQQMMLVASAGASLAASHCSSWPLTDDRAGEGTLHPVTLGCPMSTQGARAMTLDDFCKGSGLVKVDVIKLDVDGSELEVLHGAREVLQSTENKQISILMELDPALYDESVDEMGQVLGVLQKYGFVLRAVGTGAIIPMTTKELMRILPYGASMNIIASRKDI
jgi:FkbM family methyltransferase